MLNKHPVLLKLSGKTQGMCIAKLGPPRSLYKSVHMEYSPNRSTIVAIRNISIIGPV